MLNKLLCLIPILLGVAALLAAAWPGSTTPAPRSAKPPFVPQAFSLEGAGPGGNVGARHILEKAIANLSPDRVSWLRTAIRQTAMGDARGAYVTDGFLQRGPNHCARLELTVRTGGNCSRLVVVSDGLVAAQECEIAGEKPVVVSEKLLGEKEAPDEHLAKDAYLAAKGCGGPLALLKQLEASLQDLKLQTGLLDGKAVVQLHGDVTSKGTPSFGETTAALRTAYLYLDAKSLWPVRIEFWGKDKLANPCCLLKIEFPDAVLNQELSPEECERLFSYQPS